MGLSGEPEAPQAVYPAGMLGTRTEIVVATLRDLLAAEGVTWDLDGPSQPYDILRGMTDELHDLEEAGWADPAGGPSPVIGRWLLVAIAADLQAETGLRLVLTGERQSARSPDLTAS